MPSREGNDVAEGPAAGLTPVRAACKSHAGIGGKGGIDPSAMLTSIALSDIVPLPCSGLWRISAS